MNKKTFCGLIWSGLFVLAACGSNSLNSNPIVYDVAINLDEPILHLDEGQPDHAVDQGLQALDVSKADLNTPEPCEEGAFCDDGDPCTFADECKAGSCVGQTYACGDGTSCTHDLCDGFGGCTYPVRADRCLINGACFVDGDINPDAPCLACVAPRSQDSWEANDGLACDDGNFCTLNDTCLAGLCEGQAPKGCDDENFCTDDGCDPDLGCTHEPNERSCSDGNPCTVGDQCLNSQCWAGETLVLCDDNNPCTNDGCLPSEGCIHVPNGNPCSDDSICSIGDFCSNGSCQPGPESLACGDTNPCTDDSCHPEVGCLHLSNAALCDDGNPCTDGDSCVFGQCVQGPGSINCNDGNPCTEDGCDPSQDGCVHGPATGSCNDENRCTLGDFCQAGTCASGAVVVDCDDGNPCTLDTCDELGGCLSAPMDADCDDGNLCTLGDRCSDGLCNSGNQTLVCADDNICTADICDSESGCQFLPVPNTCFDGNACTLGDACVSGNCVSGTQIATCDDENPCTTDVCDPLIGCVFDYADGVACNDNNSCSFDDQCWAGVCQGTDSPCDDSNMCTEDICLPGGGCSYVLVDTPECKPEILITYPPRGAQLLGPPNEVVVVGSVESSGGGITEFLINDMAVTLDEDGAFSYPMTPRSGINILRFYASNESGGQATGVRAYAFSHDYYDPNDPSDYGVPNGLRIFMGPSVFDDNNTTTLDDFASIFVAMLGGIDLAAMIPNPLSQTSVLQCSATITAQNINYAGPEVDLYPINGGLHARVRYVSFNMGVNANMSGFLCPSASGTVSANAITVDVDLLVNVSSPGVVEIILANKNATISGLNVSLDGLLGFLVNWLVNLFEGTIASELESLIVNQLDSFKEVIEGALASLELNTTINFPPLIGTGASTLVQLETSMNSAAFDTLGGALGFVTRVTAEKGVEYETMGSIGRVSCLGSAPDNFGFYELHEMEIALFDDMLNQLLFAVWYGGSLDFSLGEADIGDGAPLASFGVTNLLVDASFMLPPVLTNCTPDDQYRMQVGDIHLHASMVFNGLPLEFDAYVSTSAKVAMSIDNSGASPALQFSVQTLDTADLEVTSVSAGGPAAKFALTELIQATLMPIIFELLTEGFVTSFPIPAIELDGLADDLPPGAGFHINGQTVYRNSGYTVLSGDVE